MSGKLDRRDEVRFIACLEANHYIPDNKKWEENKQLWIKNGIDRERDHQEIMDIFIRYDISLSKKLGDPNAEKMKKFLKCN